MPWQLNDFQQVADDGAVIVSGSQAHVPLEMEFYKGAFIHYGLGNFFYDQMGNQIPDPTRPYIPPLPAQRWEFIDRHVIYDNRYISTELLTAMLEDYAHAAPDDSRRARFILDHILWLQRMDSAHPHARAGANPDVVSIT